LKSQLNTMNANQRGFTLIELMVVIVILGILAGVVVPKIMGNPDKARVAKAKHDITALGSALDVYRLDNFVYPSTDEGLEALVSNPGEAPNWQAGGYIKKLNKDPWGNHYLYYGPELDGELNIVSLGADGAEGGEGVFTDISSQDIE
jgi:general secretion pathway protein G